MFSPPNDARLEIAKMRALLVELGSKIASVLEIAGISSREIDAFSLESSNFTPSQWERLQIFKEVLLQKIKKAIGELLVKKSEEAHYKKVQKVKKNKMIGHRKRWIQM